MTLWIAAARDRVRASFFFLPMLAVLAAIAGATALLAADESLTATAADAPFVLGSTVESARAVLSTIAAATISFAGIAFSISLLVLQRTASQHSPRIVHTLSRDPFNKRAMALVLGTFTYCLVVLRAVRGPLEDGGEPVVPSLSLTVALLLGVAAILATTAFINHSAHAMDISVVLQRVTNDALAHAAEHWPDRAGSATDDASCSAAADLTPEEIEAATVLRCRDHGWVQSLDLDRLATLAPPAGTMVVLIAAGRYAVRGAPLCHVVGDVDDVDRLEEAVNDAVRLGNSRTMQQDASYGLRQLSDVALRALSPGINDPTTAQDAIFHLATVLTELLRREPPPSTMATDRGGHLVLAEEPSHDELVHTAVAELRRAAAPHPTVSVYLLEALHLVRTALECEGLGDRAPALEQEARLVVLGSDAVVALPHDRSLVRDAFAQRFGSTADDAGRSDGQRGSG